VSVGGPNKSSASLEVAGGVVGVDAGVSTGVVAGASTGAVAGPNKSPGGGVLVAGVSAGAVVAGGVVVVAGGVVVLGVVADGAVVPNHSSIERSSLGCVTVEGVSLGVIAGWVVSG
jgi:hypothetical protein